jgi:hypothetical protein
LLIRKINFIIPCVSIAYSGSLNVNKLLILLPA